MRWLLFAGLDARPDVFFFFRLNRVAAKADGLLFFKAVQTVVHLMLAAEERLDFNKVPCEYEINHLVFRTPSVFQVIILANSTHQGALAGKTLEDGWWLGFLEARLAEMAQSLVLFQFDLGIDCRFVGVQVLKLQVNSFLKSFLDLLNSKHILIHFLVFICDHMYDSTFRALKRLTFFLALPVKMSQSFFNLCQFDQVQAAVPAKAMLAR
jgi:hypothetical protein